MNKSRLLFLAAAACITLPVVPSVHAGEHADLDKRVLEIFKNDCAGCHFGKGNVNEDGKKGKNPILDEKTTRAGLIEAQGEDVWIDEANPEESLIYSLVALPADDEDRMPKTKKKPGDPQYIEPLPPEQIALILAWVKKGK